ncbi:restriction endonuclease [Kitasatospora xanthocidica]|uniref:restriction endonuclease n=1 Tax=Kitasatospora xanthocidica TaxID=83382 RepID=UPI003570BA2E
MRFTLARTRAAASVTGRIEQWTHRPVRQATPAEPVASYTRRSLDHTLEAFEAATPTRFEEMCRELVVRDGFSDAVRVGGAGDLGADACASTPGREVGDRGGPGCRAWRRCRARWRPVVGCSRPGRCGPGAVVPGGAGRSVGPVRPRRRPWSPRRRRRRSPRGRAACRC